MLRALREVLLSARRDGSLQNLMSELLSADASDCSSEFEVVTPGAMTDGSKRRKESPPPFQEDASFEMEQLPVPPKVIKSAEDFGSALPEGVPDVRTWGTTLLQVGKFAHQNLSYEEFRVSKNAEHQRYVSWLKSQKSRTDLTSPMVDLIRYVLVRSQGPTTQGAAFDDSTVRRQFKK